MPLFRGEIGSLEERLLIGTKLCAPVRIDERVQELVQSIGLDASSQREWIRARQRVYSGELMIEVRQIGERKRMSQAVLLKPQRSPCT